MRNVKFIGITGSSGSGKSTVAAAIADHYEEQGKKCQVISLDDFYRDNLANQNTNWDHPDAFDHECFEAFLNNLKNDGYAEYPKLDFKTSRRSIEKNRTNPNAEIFIFEGIFAHHEKIVGLYHVTLFVDTHLDVCFKRRLTRDQAYRGATEEHVINTWNRFVLPMYREHIEPKKTSAHIVAINDRDDLQFDLVSLVINIDAIIARRNNTPSIPESIQRRFCLFPIWKPDNTTHTHVHAHTF